MVPTSGASEAQTARGDSELQPVPDADWREGAAVRGAETEQPTNVRGETCKNPRRPQLRDVQRRASRFSAELSTL